MAEELAILPDLLFLIHFRYFKFSLSNARKSRIQFCIHLIQELGFLPAAANIIEHLITLDRTEQCVSGVCM